MQLTIRDATAEDLQRVFDIRVSALADDFWTRIVYPHGRSKETIESGMRGWKDDVGKEGQFLKVLEDQASQKVIAFAKWHLVAKASNHSGLNRPYELSSAGQEANDDAWQAMDMAKHAMRCRFIAGQAHMYLGYLCTDPSYQGNGAGSQLLKWGTDAADEKGLPCFLLSTDSGHRLYTRRGFKDFEVFKLDGSAFGVPEIGQMWFMKRLPCKREDQD